MLTIDIGANACPVKDEIYRVARRYAKPVIAKAGAALTGAGWPNVANLAKQSPVTRLLVMHHYDRVGVLSAVFSQLKHAGIYVEETENVVFEVAAAAVARIDLDGAPPRGPWTPCARSHRTLLS